MNNRMKFFTVIILFSVPTYVCSQEDPSIDCALAKTHVEKTLCSGGNSGMGNLDLTMHDLYEAVSNSPDIDKLAISMSQRKWLEKRNECKVRMIL